MRKRRCRVETVVIVVVVGGVCWWPVDVCAIVLDLLELLLNHLIIRLKVEVGSGEFVVCLLAVEL